MINTETSHKRTYFFYLLLAIMSGWIFYFINSYGNSKFGQAITGPLINAKESHQLFHILLAIVLIIVVTRIGGFLLKAIGQPPVIGEILGGIILGPSLLGSLAPASMAYLLPASVVPAINTVAQFGIIFFMFLVGLEVDLNALKKSAHTTVAISHASIVFPFILGSALALWIFRFLAPANVTFTSFSLFIGVSMSITAFPVLARILTDQNLHKTSLGSMALTCAAIDDVTAWCLLALVTGLAESHPGEAIVTISWTIIYILSMLLVIKPWLENKISSLKENTFRSGKLMATVLIAVLFSAGTTEFIGIHALFGAFLFGTIIPHESIVAKTLNDRLQDVVRVLFLPAFFAFTGMRTQIGLVHSLQDWLFCAAIIAVAIVGKFGGTLFAARFSGLGWKNSVGLGILMNTRGLVELIVLNIGLDLGIISPRLFTMLVIMALVTTLMTGPALKLINGFDELAD